MRKALSLLAVAALAGVAPLSAQDMDPVGKYEFQTTVEGQIITGTMDITGEAGSWTCILSAEGQGQIPVNSVEVNGYVLTLIAEIPEAGELFIEVEFDGEEFTGSWTLGFDGGDLSGRKIG